MKIKCIYCLEDKPESEFRNREHVMPQCFGKFRPNNLILHQTVCDECNQYFGDDLELYLGRDTFEGVMRYSHGIKSRKLPSKYKRLKFRVSSGSLQGMIMLPRYSRERGENDYEPAMQVGFSNLHTGETDYFEPKDIPDVGELEKQGYDVKNKISVIAKDEEEQKGLIKLLKCRGINFKPKEVVDWSEYIKDGDKLLVKQDVRIDPVIYRGFCKIAFNYLSFVEGKDFVLKGDFNGIRSFIRYGRGYCFDYFGVNEPSILHDDRRYNIRTTNGHLVVIEWRGISLVGRVSIFNIATYLVKFCRNYSGIWRQIRRGHHFDINTLEINNLISGSRNIVL